MADMDLTDATLAEDCTCQQPCRACDMEYEGERCTCQDDCPVHGAYNSEARREAARQRIAEAESA